MVRTKATPKQIKEPTKAVGLAEGVQKKRRWKPGTKALREIRRYQRSTDLLIPKMPFERLIKEMSQQTALDGIKWKKDAVQALHMATEDYLTELFKKMNQLAVARKAKTIMPQDNHTIKALGIF